MAFPECGHHNAMSSVGIRAFRDEGGEDKEEEMAEERTCKDGHTEPCAIQFGFPALAKYKKTHVRDV